ncbi:MAG TPA: hypothetical protein VFF69_03780 [Phycisphaerales bacterium]|nr:hypothetical protein [Phycisphaerales bacterium]
MAKKSRMMVLSRKVEAGDEPRPLGTRPEIKRLLADFNTAPDGAPEGSLGLERLHGPGFVVELPTSIDEPMQVLATINDDETAWPVLSRICRKLGWSLIDGESGRAFI